MKKEKKEKMLSDLFYYLLLVAFGNILNKKALYIFIYFNDKF
ncbi:MAG: hypothetical protein ACYCSW_10985 [bacterium]